MGGVKPAEETAPVRSISGPPRVKSALKKPSEYARNDSVKSEGDQPMTTLSLANEEGVQVVVREMSLGVADIQPVEIVPETTAPEPSTSAAAPESRAQEASNVDRWNKLAPSSPRFTKPVVQKFTSRVDALRFLALGL